MINAFLLLSSLCIRFLRLASRAIDLIPYGPHRMLQRCTPSDCEAAEIVVGSAAFRGHAEFYERTWDARAHGARGTKLFELSFPLAWFATK